MSLLGNVVFFIFGGFIIFFGYVLGGILAAQSPRKTP